MAIARLELAVWVFVYEEKTAIGLSVGVGLGFSSVSVAGDASAERLDLDATFLGAYLRQPLKLSETYSFNDLISYRFNNGSGEVNLAPVESDWNEARAQLALSGEFEKIRISAFADYYYVTGDIKYDHRCESFELADTVGSGIEFDYFFRTALSCISNFRPGLITGRP